MFPQRVSEHMDRVWMVAQWKYELDHGARWYRRAFFKHVYRRFIHFAFKRFGIPPVKGAQVEGRKTTYFWFENGGFFSSEDQAELACTGEWHGYKDVPLDRAFPPESAQYSSLVFPRQKNPRQHRRRPNFSIVATPREEITNLEKQIQELERQIKELRQAIIR